MECPKCGYAMGPFDQTCPRCMNMAVKRAATVRARKPTPQGQDQRKPRWWSWEDIKSHPKVLWTPGSYIVIWCVLAMAINLIGEEQRREDEHRARAAKKIAELKEQVREQAEQLTAPSAPTPQATEPEPQSAPAAPVSTPAFPESRNLTTSESTLLSLNASPDQFGMTTMVGEIRNDSGRAIKYAEADVNAYDANGELLGSTLTNVADWEPGTVWQFRATLAQRNISSLHLVRIEAHF